MRRAVGAILFPPHFVPLLLCGIAKGCSEQHTSGRCCTALPRVAAHAEGLASTCIHAPTAWFAVSTIKVRRACAGSSRIIHCLCNRAALSVTACMWHSCLTQQASRCSEAPQARSSPFAIAQHNEICTQITRCMVWECTLCLHACCSPVCCLAS